MQLVRLTYRHVIDSSSTDKFDRLILKLSYDEFRMKSQAYNIEGKFSSFTQMKANDGRANSLHYKCSFAVAGLIETLQKKIPVLNDELGRAIDFETFSFEVIESDINNSLLHKVAVHFISPDLKSVLHAGDRLIFEKPGAEPDGATGFIETVTLSMKAGLAISAYKN